jgi:tetratricopeptide (TPR) repeat protein
MIASIRTVAFVLCTLLVVPLTIGSAWAAPRSVEEVEAERLRGLARDANARKDYRDAAELLERAYRLDPARPATLKDIAVALASDGRIAAAVARYKEYLRIVPGDAPAFLAMATTLSWSKNKFDLQDAEQLLTEYLQAHPDSDDAFLQRARVRAWTGSDAAVGDYRAYIAKHPDPSVKLELALALSSHADPKAFAEAIAIYDEHLASDPNDLAIVLQRARVRSWAGRTSEAIVDYRLYLEAKPDDDLARQELARLTASTTKPPDTTITGLRARVARDVGDEKAQLALASALSGLQDRASQREALALLGTYLGKHPADATILLQRARVHGWARMTTEAIRDFHAYLELHPEDDAVRLEMANVVALGDEPAAAIPLYDAYLEDHPDDRATRAHRARVLLWMGDYAAAETALLELRRGAKDDA